MRLCSCKCRVLPPRAALLAGSLSLLSFLLLLLLPVATLASYFSGYPLVLGKPWRESRLVDVLSKASPGTVVSLVLLVLAALWGCLLWAQMLAAVGLKYNIKDVQKNPYWFLVKTCCCLCPMNIRAGLHVDRAQGFRRANKFVEQMVQVTELASANARASANAMVMQAQGVPSTLSNDMLNDDTLMQTIQGLAQAEEHARRISMQP